MKQKKLALKKGFHVGIGNRHSQVAEMVLAPGNAEGGPKNRHLGSDQWLFVIAGTGRATIEQRKVSLHAGRILLIERGERHEIRNTGRAMLRTVNLYVPPAYRKSGDPLPRGRSRRKK